MAGLSGRVRSQHTHTRAWSSASGESRAEQERRRLCLSDVLAKELCRTAPFCRRDAAADAHGRSSGRPPQRAAREGGTAANAARHCSGRGEAMLQLKQSRSRHGPRASDVLPPPWPGPLSARRGFLAMPVSTTSVGVVVAGLSVSFACFLMFTKRLTTPFKVWAKRKGRAGGAEAPLGAATRPPPLSLVSSQRRSRFRNNPPPPFLLCARARPSPVPAPRATTSRHVKNVMQQNRLRT